MQRSKVSNVITQLLNNAGAKTKFPKLIDDVTKIVDANHYLDEKIASF